MLLKKPSWGWKWSVAPQIPLRISAASSNSTKAIPPQSQAQLYFMPFVGLLFPWVFQGFVKLHAEKAETLCTDAWGTQKLWVKEMVWRENLEEWQEAKFWGIKSFSAVLSELWDCQESILQTHRAHALLIQLLVLIPALSMKHKLSHSSFKLQGIGRKEIDSVCPVKRVSAGFSWDTVHFLPGTVLWLMLTAHWCCSCSVLTPSQGLLCVMLCQWGGAQEATEVWLGPYCPNWPKAVPYHRASCSVNKLGEVAGAGGNRWSGMGSEQLQHAPLVSWGFLFLSLLITTIIIINSSYSLYYFVSIIELFLR